eukprot:13264204-Alexandrium_andersonii.AAC.2
MPRAEAATSCAPRSAGSPRQADASAALPWSSSQRMARAAQACSCACASRGCRCSAKSSAATPPACTTAALASSLAESMPRAQQPLICTAASPGQACSAASTACAARASRRCCAASGLLARPAMLRRPEGRHGAQAGLEAPELQDLRPALLVLHQVCDGAQAMQDEAGGGVVRALRVHGRGHGADDHDDALRVVDGLLALRAPRGEEGEALQPALLHPRVAGVRLHHAQDHGHHARVAELRLATIVPCQLRQHHDAMHCHLGVLRVVLQRQDHGDHALGLDDLVGAVGVVGQRLQRRHGIAAHAGILLEMVHRRHQRCDATEPHDLLQALQGACELADGPAAVLLYSLVALEVVEVPDDGLHGAQAAEHAAELRKVCGAGDDVVRVELHHRVVREVPHRRDGGLEASRVVYLLEPLRRVRAVEHEQPEALLVRPLVVGAAHEGGDTGVHALVELLHGGQDLVVAHLRGLLQQAEALLQALPLLPQRGDGVSERGLVSLRDVGGAPLRQVHLEDAAVRHGAQGPGAAWSPQGAPGSRRPPGRGCSPGARSGSPRSPSAAAPPSRMGGPGGPPPRCASRRGRSGTALRRPRMADGRSRSEGGAVRWSGEKRLPLKTCGCIWETASSLPAAQPQVELWLTELDICAHRRLSRSRSKSISMNLRMRGKSRSTSRRKCGASNPLQTTYLHVALPEQIWANRDLMGRACE